MSDPAPIVFAPSPSAVQDAIAADWKFVRLESLFDIQQGKALSPKARAGKSSGAFLRTANVLWGKLDLTKVDQMDFSDDESVKLRLEPGDLLTCEGGDVGRTAMWRGELTGCAYQNHIHRLRAKNGAVQPEFYMYWMQAAILLLGLYGGEGNKTTIPNLSKSRLGAFAVPVPPHDEQRRIARVLSTIQRAIEAQGKVIAAARELKRSLIKHLFTYGPVPVTETSRVPLKETEIGPVPVHWTSEQIGELFFVQLGKMLSPKARRGVAPRPYVRNANVQWGRIDASDIAEMDFTKLEAEKFALQLGDVLVCEGGEVGRTALWKDEIRGCCYQKAIHRLRAIDARIMPEYFLYYMMTVFLERKLSLGGGTKTTIAHLPAIKLKMIDVALPPVTEQEKIRGALRAADERIQAEEKRKAALQALFKSMLHHLMTGKIRVPEAVTD